MPPAETVKGTTRLPTAMLVPPIATVSSAPSAKPESPIARLGSVVSSTSTIAASGATSVSGSFSV